MNMLKKTNKRKDARALYFGLAPGAVKAEERVCHSVGNK